MFKWPRSILLKIALAILVYFIIILVGAAIIGEIENWNYLDSFYMMVMTSTTIGYTGIIPSSVSAPGLQRNIAFNSKGEPTSITEQGLSAAISYDGDGRLKTYESAGAKHTFNYSVGDRLTSYQVEDTVAGGALIDESYTYDAAGRVGTTTASGTWSEPPTRFASTPQHPSGSTSTSSSGWSKLLPMMTGPPRPQP